MAKKTTTAAAQEVEAVATEKKTHKCCAKKAACVAYNAETAGCRAGDIYQALAAAEGSLSMKELAKAAGISEQETLLGMGWLLREGKLNVTDDQIALA